MKKIVLLLISLTGAFFTLTGQYPSINDSFGKKVIFTQVDSLVFVKFHSTLTQKENQRFMDSYSLREKSGLPYDSINLIKLYTAAKPELVNSLKSASEIEFADFAIKYSDGILQGLTNQIFLKLKKSVNYFEIEQVLKSFAISKIEPTIFNDSIFIVTLPQGSTINSLEFSNLLFEKGIVEFAEPNFIRYLFPTTSDPYYPQQWAIHNNGQFGGTSGADTKVQEAWTLTKGSSCIKIAVLDVGVDLTHPDLQANLLTGYDETGLGSISKSGF